MAKKQAVTAVDTLKKKVTTHIDQGKVLAEEQMVKVKKQLESTYATVESYAKKNPEKAAMVVAGIGAALGAAAALLMSSGKKTKGKK